MSADNPACDWNSSRLEQRAEVASFRLSEFWDVWHGSDPFDTEMAEQTGSSAPRERLGSMRGVSGAGSLIRNVRRKFRAAERA